MNLFYFVYYAGVVVFALILRYLLVAHKLDSKLVNLCLLAYVIGMYPCSHAFVFPFVHHTLTNISIQSTYRAFGAITERAGGFNYRNHAPLFA